MAKYIDATLLKAEFTGNFIDTSYSPEFIKAIIDGQPTADVQEVVRCKNCRFFDSYDKVEDFDGQCVVRDCETDKEEFCSYGNKRGDKK